MSQEIIYTSAPRGLKPNSSGFCTVLSTNGMARNLSERLESLSGYRFHFQAHDANSHLNPVNYSHLKMTVGGEQFHVLSRICDSGLDHTMRSNKLAHHVALKVREIKVSPGGGPAWTMLSPGFCETTWEGEPERVAENRKRLPDAQRAARPCSAWQAITGDAGWASVLAESALQRPPKPMSVIFPAGTETLPLVVEALHLLPPEKRWDVTFSTYFTRLEAGTECQWRFVLDGTPEADALRHDPHKPKIDLAANLGTAPDSELAEAARTGNVPQWTAPEPQQRRAAIPSPRSVANEPELISVLPQTPQGVKAPQQAQATAPLAYIEPERRLKLPYIIVGSLLLFLLITGGMIAAFMAGRQSHQLPGQVASNDAQPESAAGQKKPIALQTEFLESSEQKPKEKEPPPLPDPEPTQEVQSDAVAMAEAKPETEMSQEEPKELPLPLHDVIEKWHEHLPLPATLQNRSLSGDGNVALEANARLAEVYVDDLEKVNLSIIGADVVLPPGIKFTITPSITIDRTTKTWTIAETNPLAVSALGTPIGKFRLQDHVLTFEWAQKLRSARLKYCRLQIDAENAQGKQTAKCSLTEPIEQEPLRLKFDNKVHKTELQIDPRSLPDSKHLRMEIQVRGIDEDRLTVSPQTPFELTSNEDSTEPNSRVTIVFFDPEEVEQTEAGDGQKPKKEKLIQVEARVVERANEPPVFFIKNFVYPTLITPKENVTPDFPPLVIATPPQPVEFARNSKESAERQVLIIQSKIKKWRPALAKVTSELVDKLDRAKAAGPKFKAEQDTAQRDLDEATKRKRNYEDAMAETEQFDEWFSHLESVYGDLEEKIEIDFRLYIAVDGVETDILKSRSPGGDIPQPEEAESSSLQSIQDKGF